VEPENPISPRAADGPGERTRLPRWLPVLLALVLLSLLLMGPPVMRALMAGERPPPAPAPASAPGSSLVELPPGDDPG